MLKKITYLIVVITLLAAGSWYFLKREPTSKTANEVPSESEVPLKKQALDPNEHNFYDVDFSRKMIVHNQQGMLMTDLAIDRSANKGVTEIAREMRKRQEDATKQYASLLNGWKEDYSNLSDFPEMDGHDMYPTHPGMAQAAEIVKLRKLSGTAFDKLFLKLIVTHHQGAVVLAKDAAGQDINYGKLIRIRDLGIKENDRELKTLRNLKEE